MSDWKEHRLGDLIDVKHGFAFEGTYFRDGPPGDILLTPGNFSIGGGFQDSKLKYYVGPVGDEFVLRPGDLLVSMTDLSRNGDTLGYPAVIPEDNRRYLHNQRLGKVILKKGAPTSLDFLQWVFRTAAYRNEVLSTATGSTVRHTSPTRICAFRFLLPPEPEQQAIARLLSALERQIQINRGSNQALERIARSIFRDWFIDFGPVRTKSHGGAPYLAPDLWSLFPDQFTEDGKPVTWGDGRLADFARSSGQVVSPDTVSPDTPYIGLEHMPRRSIALDAWDTAEKVTSGKLSFNRGDFLFGKLRPYFHKVGVAPVHGICSTDIVVITPRDPNASCFVLACISQDEFVAYTDLTSIGTKMPPFKLGSDGALPRRKATRRGSECV